MLLSQTSVVAGGKRIDRVTLRTMRYRLGTPSSIMGQKQWFSGVEFRLIGPAEYK